MIYLCLTNIEKMDCRNLRQSIDLINDRKEALAINSEKNGALIPKNIEDYIENTSNQTQKKARLCGYTSLFYALKEIFGEDSYNLHFDTAGKPYISASKENIYVNLSHSETLSAVCISDEGEVGVDVQEKIEDERAARLEKRFFSNFEIKSDISKSKITFYMFEEKNGELMLSKNTENYLSFVDNKNDFTEKWSLAESVLKCDGIGFGGAEKVSEIQKPCSSFVTRILVNNKEIALAITIKRL